MRRQISKARRSHNEPILISSFYYTSLVHVWAITARKRNLRLTLQKRARLAPHGAVKLFLHQQTPEKTLSEPTDLEDVCEANFYVGEWHLLQNENSPATEESKRAARSALTVAANTCPHGNIHWLIATGELNRFGR